MSQPLINPEERKRPDFRPGVPVVLADGQTWELRKPLPRFAPSPSAPHGVAVVLCVPGSEPPFNGLVARADEAREFFAGLAALCEAVAAARAAERPELDLAAAEVALGRALLLANYDLAEDEVGALLQFSYDPEGDPEGSTLREAVVAVAYLRGPAASASGATEAA